MLLSDCRLSRLCGHRPSESLAHAVSLSFPLLFVSNCRAAPFRVKTNAMVDDDAEVLVTRTLDERLPRPWRPEQQQQQRRWLSAQPAPQRKKSVMFVCKRNSCRSQVSTACFFLTLTLNRRIPRIVTKVARLQQVDIVYPSPSSCVALSHTNDVRFDENTYPYYSLVFRVWS